MKQDNFIFNYRLHHVLFWAAVFIAWFILRMDHYSSKNMAVLVTAIKVSELALMIYITNYVLIPVLLYRKKYVLFLLVFAIVKIVKIVNFVIFVCDPFVTLLMFLQ